MELKRITVAALAAVFALSGIGSILVMQQQPPAVDAVELTPAEPDPAFRRSEDDGPALQTIDEDDTGGDSTGDDAAPAGAGTGDGDNTAGDDGTSGGNNTRANTGDNDRTAGDDGTSGGDNTADISNTGDDTGAGDTTD